MILVLEISSSETPDFKRLIQIDPELTFEDLHQIIQKTCNFDHSQLASFFITDDLWRKNTEITSLDFGKSGARLTSMRTAKLKHYLSEIGQKLIYIFDYFNDRFFYIELKENNMKTDLKEPFVAYEKGDSPTQFLISDIDTIDVDLIDCYDSYGSFGELEDYCEIYGETDV